MKLSIDTEKLTVEVDEVSCALGAAEKKAGQVAKATDITLKFSSLEEVFRRAAKDAIVTLQTLRSDFVTKTELGEKRDAEGFRKAWEKLSNTSVTVPNANERAGKVKVSAKDKVLFVREFFPGVTSDEMVELLLADGTPEEVGIRAKLARKYPKK